MWHDASFLYVRKQNDSGLNKRGMFLYVNVCEVIYCEDGPWGY